MKPAAAGATSYHVAFSADGHAQVAGRDGIAIPDQRYYVGDRVIAHAFASRIPADLADLVDVALASYLADRRAPRRPPSADRSHLHWNRRLHLTLPVRDVRRWRDPLLQSRLRDVLALLTEDAWEFDFVPRSGERRIAELQGYLFPDCPTPPLSVALFSGGLDSLAGLCRQLAAWPDDSFVVFAGGTSRRVIGAQRSLVEGVQESLGRAIYGCGRAIRLTPAWQAPVRRRRAHPAHARLRLPVHGGRDGSAGRQQRTRDL